VIKSGDPVEQEKQLKYPSLVANAIMLSNVADLSVALSSMAAEGHTVTPGRSGVSALYSRTHPTLRSIRPEHGRPASASQPPAAPLRDGLVTTFYAYSQPTPTKAHSPNRIGANNKQGILEIIFA
jgi:hypothetical protein